MDLTDEQIRVTATTTGFAEVVLGLPLYKWQAQALIPLEQATGRNGKRQNISVCAPNGSGKDSHVIPAAAFWWLALHPKGRVTVTSKSDLQIDNQTIPALNAHYKKFGWAAPTNSPRYELTTSEGGRLIAFVTNDATRAEGWHSKEGSPLLMIVNEAKSVDEGIFEAIDGRCTPDALMLISSPGLKVGRFYETHHKLRAEWTCVSAGLADCPHIPSERIDHVLATYGENHPVTRSTLYGEFMESDSIDPYVLTREQVLKCIASPPSHLPGFKYGFFDFADGRAENVFIVRNGNKFEIADAWREQNKDAVIGRATYLIRKHNLTDKQVGADAAAKDILDGLSHNGYNIHRQNFGQKLPNFQQYKSWGVFAWLTTAKKIIDREIIIPNDETLIAQAVTRKKGFEQDGRLNIEEKHNLAKRGIESPDRMDALVGCAAAVDMRMFQPARKNVFEIMDDKEHDHALGGVSVGF